jgi:NitT/TauT family transport system ATP-binding protein
MSEANESGLAVDIQSAQKTYPNGTRALLPVNLRVQAGEFITLLGPSGCGKSTLLKMVAGLLPASAGRVNLNDQALSFVFQEATLMPWASVLANVRLPLDLAGVPRVQADARVQSALQLVGLQGFANSLPRELSGGMQMRVSIARGLVTQPKLLLMDEPFGNRLDGELLALWQAQKLTVIFVTHSIHEAVFLSTRVVVMAARPGRIVEEITIDEPHPRRADFRVATNFSRYAKRLQDSLLQASGGAVEGAL